MLGKQKPKMDAKVRFQQSGFKRQLEDARGYKRESKQVREKKNGFFEFLRSSSFKEYFLLFTILLFFIYGIYGPTFLDIRHIQIQGVSVEQAENIKDKVFEYINEHPLTAQKNLLFFSKNKVARYLLEKDLSIIGIKDINKKFPGTIFISFTQRVNSLQLRTNTGNYIISNDGLVQSELATNTQISTLVQLRLHTSQLMATSTSAVTGELINYLKQLKNQLLMNGNITVTDYEMDDAGAPDVIVHTAQGFTVLADKTLDMNAALEQIRLIINDAGSASANLQYIDVRLKNRGFACMKSLPCTKPTIVIPPKDAFPDASASSTIINQK